MNNSAIIRTPQEIQALQDTIYVISGKWKLPVINAICSGKRRFNEIHQSVPNITKRMLSKELKEMEMNKLIFRTVNCDHTLIEYFSTEYCKTFTPILGEMINWGLRHRQMIRALE